MLCYAMLCYAMLCYPTVNMHSALQMCFNISHKFPNFESTHASAYYNFQMSLNEHRHSDSLEIPMHRLVDNKMCETMTLITENEKP